MLNLLDRVSHLVDAIIYTTYIGCLAHVVITGLRDNFGRQDLWILIYSAYALLPFPLPPRPRPRPRKYFVPRRVGFILALLAYITPPNNRPKPETIPHVWLLLSVGWNTFRLILAPAMSPSWILLFPPRVSLVPSLDFNRFLLPVVLRPFVYFIPLILFFILMLNLSMDDPWTLKSTSDGRPWISPETTSIPAPYDTREAFLTFLIVSIMLWVFYSLASLIRAAASPNTPHPVVYTPSRAHYGDEDETLQPDAARILLCNTLLYTGYHFPAPVSFIPFLFVSVPCFAVRKIYLWSGGTPGTLPSSYGIIARIEGVLWWILIWPPSIVLAGLWRWGYHASTE